MTHQSAETTYICPHCKQQQTVSRIDLIAQEITLHKGGGLTETADRDVTCPNCGTVNTLTVSQAWLNDE